MSLLTVNRLKKVYTTRFSQNQVLALSDVNFSIEKGEYVAIMGESGSGKTTLLNILAALDKPTSGTVLLNGKDITKINEKEICAFRRDHLGFVFQDFNLLGTFSNMDNIFLPLVLSKKKYPEMKLKLEPIARQLGIESILKKYPYEISGGQKQRVAVARAFITHPDLILADEPTGALDSKSTEELLRLFSKINENNQTILMVTHSIKAASHAQRVLFIKDGVVFLGWYYEGSDGNEYAFDPSEPVVSDMVVYAKWSETGTGDSSNSGGSGGTIVIGGVHIVTFECVQGLTYSVVSTGSSSVSFTVNEVPGFSVDSSSIEVTANGSPLEPVNGTYTVSGINSDVLVSIQGDVISMDNPDDSSIPFWVWIVLIIVIVLAVAVVYWM